MASLYKKVIGGKPYWYLREIGWVDGKPKLVSERYLSSAADIGALLDAREAAVLPERTRHLAFGDVAAVCGMLQQLDVIAIIDEVAGPRRAGASASAGTHLALAALGRLVAPCSKLAFAGRWKTTAADRFTKIPASVLYHRRCWDAMHAVGLEQLEEISRRIAVAMAAVHGLDISSVALDMANFATFTGTGNARAPIAQRGKARQKRFDLRIVDLRLVVTRDGGIPLTRHAYPGDKPDVTQFAAMTGRLRGQDDAIAATCGTAGGADSGGADMTVVFDAGQSCEANFAHLAATGLHYVGSVPPPDCPDLLAVPAARRSAVDSERFEGLTAFESRREAYGQDRRVTGPQPRWSPPTAPNPTPKPDSGR